MAGDDEQTATKTDEAITVFAVNLDKAIGSNVLAGVALAGTDAEFLDVEDDDIDEFEDALDFDETEITQGPEDLAAREAATAKLDAFEAAVRTARGNSMPDPFLSKFAPKVTSLSTQLDEARTKAAYDDIGATADAQKAAVEAGDAACVRALGKVAAIGRLFDQHAPDWPTGLADELENLLKDARRNYKDTVASVSQADNLSELADLIGGEITDVTSQCDKAVEKVDALRSAVSSARSDLPAKVYGHMSGEARELNRQYRDATSPGDVAKIPDACDAAQEKLDHLVTSYTPCLIARGLVDDALVRLETEGVQDKTRQKLTKRYQALVVRMDAVTYDASVFEACLPGLDQITREVGLLLDTYDKLKTCDADLAKREAERSTRVLNEISRLDAVIQIQKDDVQRLREAIRNATSYEENERLRGEFAAKQAQLEDSQARSEQLKDYIDATADHIREAEAADALQSNPYDLDTKWASDDSILTWTKENPNAVMARSTKRADDAQPVQPVDMSATELADYIDALNADADTSHDGMPSYKATIAAELAKLKTDVTKAKNTVVVEDKLYFDEPDVTMISADQSTTLVGLIEKAEAANDDGQVVQASAMMQQIVALFRKYQSARRMPLPAKRDVEPSKQGEVERSLASAQQKLDQLWATGLDVEADDNNLKAELATIRSHVEAAISAGTEDFDGVLAELAAYRQKLDRTRPKPMVQADIDAKIAARNKSNEAFKTLSAYYQLESHPLTDEERAALKPSEYIVTREGGVETCYAIKKKSRDGDVDARDRHYNNIPREAIEALRRKAEMVAQMGAQDMPGCAEEVERLAAEVAAQATAIMAADETYETIRKMIKLCEAYLVGKAKKSKKALKEWRPAGVTAVEQKLDAFKSSWESTIDPAGTLTKIEAIRDTLIALDGQGDTMKSKHGEVKDKLDGIEDRIKRQGRWRRDSETAGNRLEEIITFAMSDFTDGRALDPDPAIKAQQEEWIATIKARAAELQSMDSRVKGLHGDYEKRLREARIKLDTKSQKGIDDADTDADNLISDLDDLRADLAVDIDADFGTYLKNMASFLDTAADGAKAATQGKLDTETYERACKDNFKAAKSALKKHRKHPVYAELKDVLEGMEAELKTLKSQFKNSTEFEASAREFKRLSENLAEFKSDLEKIAEPESTDVSFSLDGIERDIASMAATLKSAINAAKSTMEGKADDPSAIEDPVEKQQAEDAQALSTEVAGLFVKAAEDALWNKVKFKDAVKTQVEAADDAKKRAIAREAALAEIRAMRELVTDHPATKVYRDNPFDRGSGWPAMRKTLINAENQITRNLKP